MAVQARYAHPRRLSALALALVAGAGAAPLLAPPARAQDLPAPGDGFAWEQVGDVGIDAWDLTFGADAMLWATGDDGPSRLDTTRGASGVWTLLYDRSFNGAILPLGRDTLLAARGRTERSTDGGKTWAVVTDVGEDGLYEVPAGYPFAGRILAGATEAIGYSTDRGATFTASIVPDPDGNTAGAEAFTALPPGTDHPGRILAAGRWGVNISDDGGATFRESGLWQVLYYIGEAIGVVERPGGGYRAVMVGRISGQAGARAWVSDDDGQTWLPQGGYPLPEGPPDGPSNAAAVAFCPLGGSSALAVLGRGTVYRTDDAGETWEAVGRAPDIDTIRYARAAALRPDGRLYVGLSVTGPEDGWVWRTEKLYPLAIEPAPEPRGLLDLEIAPNPFREGATVTLTLREPLAVQAAVYDVLGRRVAGLADGRFGAGRHTVPLTGAALPPGVYVVRVAAGGAFAARTATRLR